MNVIIIEWQMANTSIQLVRLPQDIEIDIYKGSVIAFTYSYISIVDPISHICYVGE